MFGTHVWSRDPPCARHSNKEYLLNSPLTIESSTLDFHGIRTESRTWGYWWMKSSTWPGSVHLQPRRPTVSWAASKAPWSAGQGSRFCPSSLLWWDPTQNTACRPGAPSTRRTWSCWSGSRGGPQRWSEGWSTSPSRKGWESWGCSAWRRQWGDLIAAFQYLKGAFGNDGATIFSKACCNKTRNNGFKLRDGRFRVHKEEIFYHEGGESLAQVA